MMQETRNRINYAINYLNTGKITITEAWQYCNELERLNNYDSVCLMKTLVKAYDAWSKQNGYGYTVAFKVSK